MDAIHNLTLQSYLTTQGNRVPFIHNGSRLSPESYASSDQPQICQPSQQMQNNFKKNVNYFEN